MTEHEDFYTPEQIDEQIDALLRTRSTSARDQRLASDLRMLLEHRDEDASSIQSVLLRLMNGDTVEQLGKMAPPADSRFHNHEQGRLIVMPETRRSKYPAVRRQPMFRVLTTFAAVLVVGVLVGSMLLVLDASRPAQTQTGNKGTPASLPTQGSATQPKQVIFKSEQFGDVAQAAWSPDGSRIAAVTRPSENASSSEVQSWDALTGTHVLTYPTGGETLFANVAWSPDGTKLAVAGSSHIYLFDAKTAQVLRTLLPPSVALNINGATLMDTAHGMQKAGPFSNAFSLSGAPFAFTDVAWSADGAELAAGLGGTGIANVVLVWNANSGAVVKTLTGFGNGASTIYKVSWSPDGKLLAVNDYLSTHSQEGEETQVWETAIWQLVHTYPQTTDLSWSPDGKQLALVEADPIHGTAMDVQIVDAQSGHVERRLVQTAGWPTETFLSVFWSPDGTYLMVETVETQASGPPGPGHETLPSSSETLRLWNVTNGAQLPPFADTHDKHMEAWSPDGKYLSWTEAVNHSSSFFIIWQV